MFSRIYTNTASKMRERFDTDKNGEMNEAESAAMMAWLSQNPQIDRAMGTLDAVYRSWGYGMAGESEINFAVNRAVLKAEAKALGLAYKVCPAEELDEVTMKFAKKLAAGPLVSYKNIKKQIYDTVYSDYRKWLEETEIPTQAECANSNDFREGCSAFIEKRKPQFEGK